MRRLVTGIDAAGRSCCVERADVHFEASVIDPELARAGVYETDQCPPPGRPAGHGVDVDTGLAPGLVRWSVIRFPPGFAYPMHHTDTIDLDLVLEGSAELVLDDGAHLLEAGDCVAVTGVDHAWRVGPQGVTMSVTTVGTPPAPDGTSVPKR